jgi:glycosyltransferase involved in cell wall biosynthesis
LWNEDQEKTILASETSLIAQNNAIDISVVIATYNRANVLSETLEKFAAISSNGPAVEFVIVDNNSTDHTSQVIDAFESRLTLRHLFEPKPGKNVALNKGLREAPLGPIVVFTDDDVDPDQNYFNEITECCERLKDYSIFGGLIYPVWPDGEPPRWEQAPGVNAGHDLGEVEMSYPEDRYPWGPNMWLRREVFEKGYRYGERLGPTPKKRKMGSETSFLMVLRQDGYEIMYCPSVRVGHRLQSHEIRFTHVFKRAFYYGRGLAHLNPFPRRSLWQRSRFAWRLLRSAILLKYTMMWVGEACLSFRKNRINRWLDITRWLSYNLELIREVSILSNDNEAL